MHSPPQQPALQQSTLTLYGELLCRCTGWGGELVFAAFTGAAKTGLSAASSLAGAASLIVDDDAESVHANNRDAAFDFLVNTLDEALRSLKNEVRRARPLAVALLADPQRILDEAAERGLAPRFLLSAPGHAPVTGFGEAPEVAQIAFSPDGLATAPLDRWLEQRHWSRGVIPLVRPGQPGHMVAPERPAEHGGEGSIRANWTRNLSRYQRSAERSGELWAWLTPDEVAQIGPSTA